MKKQAHSNKKEIQVCTIAANFAAEPVKDSLQYWFEELKLSIQVQFAPFDQIIQVLLDESNPMGKSSDFLAVYIQCERWHNPTRDAKMATLEGNIDDICHAFSIAAKRGHYQLFVIICPASPVAKRNAILQDAERRLASRLGAISGINVTTSDQINNLYPPKSYDAQFDQYLNEHAQIPYTELTFATLGTILARRLYHQCVPPRKAIVVDCDNTLWSGLAGESGLDVVVSDGHRNFQKFLVDQSKAGRLICLCSKNNAADVERILEQHSAMVLKRQHLAATRINWENKPANLSALSSELSLDLSSFIFIDDDKFECAAVRAVYPQVLTIECPPQLDGIDDFFNNVWEFDIGPQTAEDLQRTNYYQQDKERERARKEVSSLHDFLATLELSVRFRSLAPEDLPRAVQLLARTNQFNLNGHRRSVAELTHLLNRNDYILTIVNSSDRFGDYGDIGLVICHLSDDAVQIDSLVLSCRALGRGIERCIANELLKLASQHALVNIDFAYYPTPKNDAVRRFFAEQGVIQKGGRWIAELSHWQHSSTGNEARVTGALQLMTISPQGNTISTTRKGAEENIA